MKARRLEAEATELAADVDPLRAFVWGFVVGAAIVEFVALLVRVL